MHSVALDTCVSDPTTKICMKIDPYYQRQECSPGILVSRNVSFMRIFGESAGEGASNESEVVENGDFRFSLAISSEPSKATFIILYYVAH